MRTDPYNRIVKAASCGAGVLLSAAEVRALRYDGAIETRAAFLKDNPDEWAEQVRLTTPPRSQEKE